MRIRDWSSDVCSAELLRRRAPATGREQRAGAAAPVVEVGLVARGSDDLLDVLRVLVLDQEPLVGRLLDDGQVVLLTQPTAGARGARVVGLRERAQAVVDQRSEEHTSELQSLMRISYAVFCLKETTQLAR